MQPFAQHGNNRWVTRSARYADREIAERMSSRESWPKKECLLPMITGNRSTATPVEQREFQAVPADGSAATAMTNAPTPAVTQENGAP